MYIYIYIWWCFLCWKNPTCSSIRFWYQNDQNKTCLKPMCKFPLWKALSIVVAMSHYWNVTSFEKDEVSARWQLISAEILPTIVELLYNFSILYNFRSWSNTSGSCFPSSATQLTIHHALPSGALGANVCLFGSCQSWLGVPLGASCRWAVHLCI